MAKRFVLLGFVGSGLALNAIGLSHFNTGEMSSIRDTGTGSAGKNGTGEGSTDGGPFNVKAMVKHLFQAGNHLLVPMEVQTNRRMRHILRHLMAEVREGLDVQTQEMTCCVKDEVVKTFFTTCEGGWSTCGEEASKAWEEANQRRLQLEKKTKELEEAEKEKAELEAKANKLADELVHKSRGEKVRETEELVKLNEKISKLEKKVKAKQTLKAYYETEAKIEEFDAECAQPKTSEECEAIRQKYGFTDTELEWYKMSSELKELRKLKGVDEQIKELKAKMELNEERQAIEEKKVKEEALKAKELEEHKLPIENAHNDKEHKLPIENARSDKEHKLPIENAHNDKEHKLPIENAHNDKVDADNNTKEHHSEENKKHEQEHKLPVENAHNDKEHKLPIESAHTDKEHKLPIENAHTDKNHKQHHLCSIIRSLVKKIAAMARH